MADSGEEKAQLGKAARAFSRCVQHEPDCGDAWANLAACRLRSGQAAMAKNALDGPSPRDRRLAVVGKSEQVLLHAEKDAGGHGRD